MEDIRTLLRDHEAAFSPESLAYLLRGLNAALHELVQEGSPTDAAESARHREMVHAVSSCAELFSLMLSRWMGKHIDDCRLTD